MRALNGDRRRFKRLPTWQTKLIVDKVASDHSVAPADILGYSRFRDHVNARKALIRTLYDLGFGVTQIGGAIGRDHTTVLHHLSDVRHG